MWWAVPSPCPRGCRGWSAESTSWWQASQPEANRCGLPSLQLRRCINLCISYVCIHVYICIYDVYVISLYMYVCLSIFLCTYIVYYVNICVCMYIWKPSCAKTNKCVTYHLPLDIVWYVCHIQLQIENVQIENVLCVELHAYNFASFGNVLIVFWSAKVCNIISVII